MSSNYDSNIRKYSCFVHKIVYETVLVLSDMNLVLKYFEVDSTTHCTVIVRTKYYSISTNTTCTVYQSSARKYKYFEVMIVNSEKIEIMHHPTRRTRK